MPVVRISSLQELDAVAAIFLDQNKHHKIFAFTGEMGVGKTTFIKALCSCLGVKNMVNSPSFTIVNEYLSQSNGIIYHFDFYRIKNKIELLDIGIEEYFTTKAIVFIEWAEKAIELLPAETLKVKISTDNTEARILEW